MADTLELKIVSLKEVVLHDYVDSVTLPAAGGEITVLPNHAPLIATLAQGTVIARFRGEERRFDVSGGALEATPESRLTVLLNA